MFGELLNEVYTDEVGRTLSEPIKVKKLWTGLFIEYRFFRHFNVNIGSKFDT